MGRFIANYVKGCTDCQQMKVNTHPTIPPLMPIKSTHRDRLFVFVTCDFVTKLPQVGDHNALMVVVDHNSIKGVIPIPTDENVTAL